MTPKVEVIRNVNQRKSFSLGPLKTVFQINSLLTKNWGKFATWQHFRKMSRNRKHKDSLFMEEIITSSKKNLVTANIENSVLSSKWAVRTQTIMGASREHTSHGFLLHPWQRPVADAWQHSHAERHLWPYRVLSCVWNVSHRCRRCLHTWSSAGADAWEPLPT